MYYFTDFAIYKHISCCLEHFSLLPCYQDPCDILEVVSRYFAKTRMIDGPAKHSSASLSRIIFPRDRSHPAFSHPVLSLRESSYWLSALHEARLATNAYSCLLCQF